MFILFRFFKRLKFRRSIKKDESINVINGMAKARKLYKELSVKAHPDRNPEHIEEAEDLMRRIVANKFNYEALVMLEKEVNEKL